MSQSIFRKTALERLSSPDQLDQLMQVTTPRGWLALAALGILALTVILFGLVWTIPVTVKSQCVLSRSIGTRQISSAVDGRLEWRVDVGDEVKAGDVLARIALSASSAIEVYSPSRARVLQIKTADGSQVSSGTPLVSLELIGELPQHLKVIVYIPPSDARKIREGMEVQITPALIKREEAGFMLGKVTSVGVSPVTPQSLARTLGSPELAQVFLASGVAPVEVHVDLTLDPDSPGGYKWSLFRDAEIAIPSGTLCSAEIVLDRQRPIELVLPIK